MVDVLEYTDPVDEEVILTADEFSATFDVDLIENGTDLFFHNENGDVSFNRNTVCNTRILALHTNDAANLSSLWYFQAPALGINKTKEVLENSEITNVTLSSAGIGTYDIDEDDFGNNMENILVHALNDVDVLGGLIKEYDADIIVIFTETSQGFSGELLGVTDASFEFGPLPVVCVNIWETSDPNFTFTHEVFHRYFARHANAELWVGEEGHPYASAAEYDYGSNNPLSNGGEVSTLMYNFNPSKIIPYVTNPDVMYNPPGLFTPEIQIGRDFEDNARIIEENSCLVSTYDEALDDFSLILNPINTEYCLGAHSGVLFFFGISGESLPITELGLEVSYNGTNYFELEPEEYSIVGVGFFIMIYVEVNNPNLEVGDNIFFKMTAETLNGQEAETFSSVTATLCPATPDDDQMFVMPTSESSFTSDLYPNPTSDIIFLEELIDHDMSIVIKGVDGSFFFSDTNNGRIEVSHLPNGTYTIQYLLNGTYRATKFVKIH